MLLEAKQNRMKPSVVWSRAGKLVSCPSKTRAANTKPFLIHCFGRSDESRERNIWGSIAGRTGVIKSGTIDVLVQILRAARVVSSGEGEGLSCTTGTAELNLKAGPCWSRDSWLWEGTSEGVRPPQPDHVATDLAIEGDHRTAFHPRLPRRACRHLERRGSPRVRAAHLLSRPG